MNGRGSPLKTNYCFSLNWFILVIVSILTIVGLVLASVALNDASRARTVFNSILVSNTQLSRALTNNDKKPDVSASMDHVTTAASNRRCAGSS